MSFRSKLRLFFAAIVVLPMAALAFVLVQVSSDARTGKADSALDASLTTAAALYGQETRISANRSAAAARHLREAIRDRPANLQQLVERELERLGIAELRVLGPGGSVLAQTGVRGIGRRQTPVELEGTGKEIGTVEVAESSADEFASEITGLTGRAVQLSVDGLVVGSTQELEGAPVVSEVGELEQNGQELRVSYVSLDEPDGQARLAVAAPAAIGGTEITPPIAAAGLAAFLAAALMFVTFLTRALEGQVETMLEAARQIGSGDFSHRVPVAGDDELAGLAREFNKMSERLGGQVAEIRRQQAELNMAVRRIGELAASGLDRDGLLTGIGEAAVAATQSLAGLVASASPDSEDQLVGASPSSAQLALLERAAADSLAGGSGDVADGQLFAIAHPLPGHDGQPIGAMAVARPNEYDRPSRDVLSYLVGQATVSMENLTLHETVAEQAVTDALTGVANKRRFEEWIALEAERAKRFDHSLSLLMLDVDDFKPINDTRGHLAGDEVLRMIGREIATTLREVDLPARYGGEEFAVGLTETDAGGARLAAERIRELIASKTVADPAGGPPIRVTVSIGTATLPDAAADAASLVAVADGALYAAKAAGKNCVRSAGQ